MQEEEDTPASDLEDERERAMSTGNRRVSIVLLTLSGVVLLYMCVGLVGKMIVKRRTAVAQHRAMVERWAERRAERLEMTRQVFGFQELSASNFLIRLQARELLPGDIGVELSIGMSRFSKNRAEFPLEVIHESKQDDGTAYRFHLRRDAPDGDWQLTTIEESQDCREWRPSGIPAPDRTAQQAVAAANSLNRYLERDSLVPTFNTLCGLYGLRESPRTRPAKDEDEQAAPDEDHKK